MLGENAPQDWGIADETEWVSNKPLSGVARLPALEGHDVIGFIESVNFAAGQLKQQPAHDNRKQAAMVQKCDPGFRAQGNRCVQGSAPKPTTSPAQRMEQARKAGKWGGRMVGEKQSTPPTPKPERKQIPLPSKEDQAPKEERVIPQKEQKFNTVVPSRASRGAKKILIEENDLKNNFPDPADQERVLKMAEAINSQLGEDGDIKKETGPGGKTDRTLLFENAKAIAERDDKEWNELLSSGPPYPQDKVDAFRHSVFIRNVSPREAEYIYSYLPRKARKTLSTNGTPEKFFTGEGDTPQEQSMGTNGNDARGVMILNTYLKQGGRCAYSGNFVPLGAAEAEHINVQSKGGLDHPVNLVMIRSAENRLRGSRPIANLVELAKKAFGNGTEEDRQRLEKTRAEKAEGASGKDQIKKEIESIPLEDLLSKPFDGLRKGYDEKTGGNKGTQYLLRKIDFYGVGERLRGGQAVLPSSFSIPMGRMYWGGNQEQRDNLINARNFLRKTYKAWIHEGTGNPQAYIDSLKSALIASNASEKDFKKAFSNSFFKNIADTHNDWLIKNHGYNSVTAEELQSYYESTK